GRRIVDALRVALGGRLWQPRSRGLRLERTPSLAVEVPDRTLKGQSARQIIEPRAHGRLGGTLLAHVERGVDPQAAIEQLLLAVLTLDVLAHELDEVRGRD